MKRKSRVGAPPVVREGDPDTIPGLPFSGGQTAGLWGDAWTHNLDHLWNTASWATRQLAAEAQINFAAEGTYYLSARMNNGATRRAASGLRRRATAPLRSWRPV